MGIGFFLLLLGDEASRSTRVMIPTTPKTSTPMQRYWANAMK